MTDLSETQVIVRVVAFRHVVPGEGIGGFEWDLHPDEARRRVQDAGVYEDDNCEVWERNYHVPWFQTPISDDERDGITAILDGFVDEDWPRS